MKATDKAEMYRRIEAHGRELLALYPCATVTDPVKLCKRLRTLESKAHRHAEMLCGVESYCNAPEEQHEATEARILASVARLLGKGGPEVFINLDPRGYALKIESDTARDLRVHKDWGGYGIVAPDFTPVQ